MRDSTYIIDGTVAGFDERSGVLTIKAPCDDWQMLTKREVRKVKVQLIDGRSLSDKQRRACYALIGAIAEWSGDDKTSIKQYMKMEFWKDHLDDLNDQIFSLSNAPMSLVAEFQRFLVRFIVSNDIPTNWSLLGFVDDVGDYIYACLISRKCCICGRHADLHHVDHVGVGRDRDEIVHEGMRVLPLCREHHNEVHLKGPAQFEDLYHLGKGIELDKTLCRIYGLKTRRKQNAESHYPHGAPDPRP